MKKFNPAQIEAKWQKVWQETDLYKTAEEPKKPFYNLTMFPYPSGNLHIGHWAPFTPTDTLARFTRMQGYDVLCPIGFDAFGLPAENAAIKRGLAADQWTDDNIAHMTEQIKSMGTVFDWNKVIDTSKSEYYRWTQWLFLQFFKAGQAYQAEGLVNWCPSCQTVLANEQVVGGKCERCDSVVERKNLKQWYFKITDYADRLLNNLDKLDWPEKIKLMQRNWIGRSEGALVKFAVDGVSTHPPDLAYSFLMGADKITDAELHKLGIKIQGHLDNGARTLSIPESVLVDYEHLLTKKLSPGYWNEYIGREIVFLFKDKKGGIERLVLNPDTAKQINDLAQKYAGANFRDPWTMLKDNSFYKDVLPVTIEVFTTRPDTLFGATFIVIAPEHPLVDVIATDDHKTEVQKYVKAAGAKTDVERQEEVEKTGVFTGRYATSPVNGEQMPIWVADYVLMGYGTGAIMAVPAHDERDWEFANKYGLQIRQVILGGDVKMAAHSGEGKLINSGEFDGMTSDNAKSAITHYLHHRGLGESQTQYRLRDWLISRQRYWGAPIPIIHCQKCGAVAVPESDLPVVLPLKQKFAKTGKSPLLDHPDFTDTKCPKCNGKAKRETDTMDTFVDSSWYFLRYPNPSYDKGPFDPAAVKTWLPVDRYIGGAEHAVMHLLYARYFTMFLHDQKLLDFEEPFKKLINQGVILGPDGNKMSKSKGNVIDPDDYVVKYGSDAVRLYLMFMGPYEDEKPWDASRFEGTYRFITRVWDLVTGDYEAKAVDSIKETELVRLLHKTLKKVGDDIEAIKFNTAIAALMELVNTAGPMGRAGVVTTGVWHEFCQALCLMLAPLTPHLAEEIWQHLGGTDSVHLQGWPEYDSSLLKDDAVTIVIQVNGKLKGEFVTAVGSSRADLEKCALEENQRTRYAGEAEIIRVIVVPDRLVNLVTKS